MSRLTKEEKLVRARLLARNIYRLLNAENWGDIETETFANVSEGFADPTTRKEDEMLYNKISLDEAIDSTVSLERILITALDALDEARGNTR